MSVLFGKPTPSYAQEQLRDQLVALSTIPVATPSAASATQAPLNRNLVNALTELTGPHPPTLARLEVILTNVLLSEGSSSAGVSTQSAADAAIQIDVVSRAVSVIWAQVMQKFVEDSGALEENREWWDNALASRFGVVTYFIQSYPARLFAAITSSIASSQFTPKSVGEKIHAIHWPGLQALFRPLHEHSGQLAEQLTALAMSPIRLTRREMLGNRLALANARDAAADRLGLLANKGAPHWEGLSAEANTRQAVPGVSTQQGTYSVSTDDILSEANRVYGVLCDVLEIPRATVKEIGSGAGADRPEKRSRKSVKLETPIEPLATPTNLLAILDTYLPQSRSQVQSVLATYGRPSALTRLWPGFILLPPASFALASLAVRNKEWMKEQLLTAKDTIKAFFVQWVWEPIEDIGKTIRGGGEGLGVAPETVKADQESLERMVYDFGRDYYHLSPASLEELQREVAKGDMDLVLKAYEKEIQQPVKNAVMGSLIRTLLIQVQKTKTDLSAALMGLDSIIKSQQLTFAFVGVAPSVLVLYGVWGWFSSLVRGENRGKARRQRYWTNLRRIERLLLTAPEEESHMSDKTRGMLIVSVGGLRIWAAGIGSSMRQAFLDDVRLVESQALTRNDKLIVVNRIYRCWGVDGRGAGA